MILELYAITTTAALLFIMSLYVVYALFSKDEAVQRRGSAVTSVMLALALLLVGWLIFVGGGGL